MNIDKLRQQLIEQHGKIAYSQTTDEVEYGMLETWKKRRLRISLVLAAITASPAIIKLFGDYSWWSYVSAIAGVVLICLSSYSLSSDTDSKLARLSESKNALWLVREKYVALLTDYESIPKEKIRVIRDELVLESNEIYKKRPQARKKSYKKAQQQLQQEEVQTFNEGEAEKLLPTSFRND